MKYLLSIDGGGIRGLVPLYFLLHLEKDLIKKTGKGIFDTFDMYAGTSVGAIIIGSIVYTEFKSIQDLIDTMYTKENFKKLFTKYPNIMRTCMMRPKYSGRFKTKLLRQYLKDTTIVNTEKKVIIPVYSVLEQKTKFYKSYYVSDKDKYNKDNSQLLLSSIIDASSAAPVYFPSTEYYSDHEEDDTIQSPVKRVGIDGAVFSNNPSDCLYADALRLYPGEDIFILSIGTGTKDKSPLKIRPNKWGGIQWLYSGITNVILESNQTTADYRTRHFSKSLGHKYIRVQGKTDVPLDGVEHTGELIALAKEWYDVHRDSILEHF